jgi:hypothetical protein
MLVGFIAVDPQIPNPAALGNVPPPTGAVPESDAASVWVHISRCTVSA